MSSTSKPEFKIDWATHQAAAFACKHWHYSGSMPVPPIVKIGVWESGTFIGVVLFSRGASTNLSKPYRLDQTECCELTRVALTSHHTPVSRVVAIAIKFLRKTNPGLRLIVSFADPYYDHHGGIYQAGGWIYSGQSGASKTYLGPSGKRYHERQVSNSGYSIEFGERRRAPKRSECQAIDTPGKHRYLMPLDNGMRAQVAPLSQPYPKRPKQAMTGTTGTAEGQHLPGRSISMP